MRAGDIVYHWPSGEPWRLAYDDGEGRVACFGWPPGEAEAQHCVLMVPATEAEHREAVMELVASRVGDLRKSYSEQCARDRGWIQD